MTKPMKTEHLPSGHPGHNLPKDHTMTHPDHPKVPLTPEQVAAGMTPNSGKLHKDGSIVHGQSPEQDAKRAAERAAEAAGLPEPPENPDPPMVDPVPAVPPVPFPDPTPAPNP